ncbi:GDSL-type esterase/lipase family protein [Streptomyces sp. NPDC002088]|uniref:GDSL-type esterase/lipase family protein n=1 Tax=Streptomyces sp. NPDC002088 TaxID=3154665 RepID=UPI00332A8ADB
MTLSAGAAGYRTLDGTPYQGTIRLTPSVSRVVSAEHGVIALGSVNVTLGASGEFTETLLAIDADGFEPSGWTYRVDEEFTNAPGKAYSISLPAAAPTVALPSLSPVDSATGTVQSPAVLSVNGETGIVVLDAADVGAVASSDPRLSDSRTPTAHAASHGSGGSDPVTVALSQVSGLSTALAGKADGPATATAGAVPRFADATGKILKDSSLLVADDGSVTVVGKAGFNGATPVARQTVAGSRADGTALASLLTAVAATGLITDSSSAGIPAAWRQRHLPDPAIADSLYTGTAPTISTAQTTTPTSGYIKYAPAGVTLSGTDVTGPFSYMGAGGFQVGVGTPDSSYVLPLSKYPNTYASGQAIWSVEFGCDAQTIQVRMKWISAATMFRLSVDGRKVTDLMQSSGGTGVGSGHLITIDFGSATPRRIRLDFTTFPFGGVYIPPSATLWGVPSQGGRLMVLGDSISDGSAQNTGAGSGTWFARAARFLGATDAWEQGRGGTGYITPGSYATFGDRVAADVVAWLPTRLVIWGGYNDNTGTQSVIAAAAASLYSAIKTGLPSCEVYVIGCWAPTGSPAASIVNTDNTLKAAAAAADFPFISPLTGSIYDSTGTLVATHGAWITAANTAGYIGADAIHPTDAGHIYLARRITAAIRALMPA